MPHWSPARHADRRPLLIARNRIKAAIRDWFETEGFTEVEPAALCVSPGNETHLHAFATEAVSEAGARQRLYLHTSPEFAMKKLLAAGETRIFAFSNVYRNREQGSPLHAPEFAMLEWYRVGAPVETLFADCSALLRIAATAAGAGALLWRDARCDPFAAPERLRVAEAFARDAGVDLGSALDHGGAPRRDALAAAMTAAGLRASPEDSWSDLFSRALVARVEPNLGRGRPTILFDYPAPEAALARVNAADPRFAERFELYACGVELANGFGELTDAAEQRRRFEADMDEKQRLYGERYPLDEDFLAALAQMPESSGCALGFDRLVMLATGAPTIADVQWMPAP